MLACLVATPALNNGQALTPPMGFNSYMAPQSGEAGLGAIADFMVSSGLRAAGYVFVNTDEGWENSKRDDQGRLQWSKSAYPSGGPAFIAKLHKQKLKFGSMPRRGSNPLPELQAIPALTRLRPMHDQYTVPQAA